MKRSVNFRGCWSVHRRNRSHSFSALLRSVYSTSATACGEFKTFDLSLKRDRQRAVKSGWSPECSLDCLREALASSDRAELPDQASSFVELMKEERRAGGLVEWRAQG